MTSARVACSQSPASSAAANAWRNGASVSASRSSRIVPRLTRAWMRVASSPVRDASPSARSAHSVASPRSPASMASCATALTVRASSIDSPSGSRIATASAASLRAAAPSPLYQLSRASRRRQRPTAAVFPDRAVDRGSVTCRRQRLVQSADEVREAGDSSSSVACSAAGAGRENRARVDSACTPRDSRPPTRPGGRRPGRSLRRPPRPPLPRRGGRSPTRRPRPTAAPRGICRGAACARPPAATVHGFTRQLVADPHVPRRHREEMPPLCFGGGHGPVRYQLVEHRGGDAAWNHGHELDEIARRARQRRQPSRDGGADRLGVRPNRRNSAT